MYSTEMCECGILRITVSVNSFTGYLLEMTTTNDILIHLRTKYGQLRLCLPNRLWSILHIVLHWSWHLSDWRNTYTHVLFEILKSFFSFLWGMVVYMPRGSPDPVMFMCLWAFQVVLVVKNPAANAGDIREMGSIPGAGRSPEGEHGNPLQHPCLENPLDGGAWWALVHTIPKSWTWCQWLSTAHDSLS